VRLLSQPTKSCRNDRFRGTLGITKAISNNFVEFDNWFYLNIS